MRVQPTQCLLHTFQTNPNLCSQSPSKRTFILSRDGTLCFPIDLRFQRKSCLLRSEVHLLLALSHHLRPYIKHLTSLPHGNLSIIFRQAPSIPGLPLLTDNITDVSRKFLNSSNESLLPTWSSFSAQFPLDDFSYLKCFLAVLMAKNPPANAGDTRNMGSIPGSGRSPRVGNGTSLQYCCLGNSMDKGVWKATVQEMQRVGHD